MSFTCDSCAGDYEPSSTSAVARVYIEDSRCNHVEASCPHCGAVEVVFLGPRRLERLVARDRLRVRVAAEPDAELRRYAEDAWAAVGGLTAEDEDLVEIFGKLLVAVPDELLWRELEGGATGGLAGGPT